SPPTSPQHNIISSITTIPTPHNPTHPPHLLPNQQIITQLPYDYPTSKPNKLSHLHLPLTQSRLKQTQDETLPQYIQQQIQTTPIKQPFF
ncbi:lipase-like domain-containing protein, partial [Staphylococcus epidermidis]